MTTAAAAELVRDTIVKSIRSEAQPLRGTAGDYDRLLAQVGNARFVIIGDATHGTHEFYRERAQFTKRLILEKGFGAVAVAADWPDAYGSIALYAGAAATLNLGKREIVTWP